MTATITATITGVSLVIVERNEAGLVCQTIATEARPANLAAADQALAFYSLGRVAGWDLDDNGGVSAEVRKVDNRFNGTVAARLWEAVGTTHGEWETAQAKTVQDGDLISNLEVSEPYVVAGSRYELDTMRVHMVRDGATWADRWTTDFPACQLVKVARRKA
jgi:hypothetical protein